MEITELLSIVGLSSIVSILLSTFVNWFTEEHNFKRDQNITFLKERIDSFYSPMIFHFENMRSWGAAWTEQSGMATGYVFAAATLADKLEDMKNLMRSGLRLVSPTVEQLWYNWQPYAIAVVERRRGNDLYPSFTDAEFQIRSSALHNALKQDRQGLTEAYKKISKSIFR